MATPTTTTARATAPIDWAVAAPEPPEWLEEPVDMLADLDAIELEDWRYMCMLADEEAERELYYSIEDDYEWIARGC